MSDSFRDLEDMVLGVCNTTFGTSATYTPTVGSPVSIVGVFDNAHIEVDEVSSLRPVFRIKLADLDAAPAKGDQVTINETEYRVMVCEKDSYGGAILILQKV
jgi:hypothetical protein